MSLESIYPTLFVGLGGAGGHVLGRLNRLFQGHFGAELAAAGDASPLQFLLLDTDDFEKLDSEVRDGLGGAERNFLSLSHFNPRRYAERQLTITDSDVHRWLDRNALRYLDDAIIHDGASRLRLLGRLCLHFHYERVEQRIRDKIAAALDASVHTQAERISPEPRPFRVFLVTSSCGGTGSGIFLDVAGMVSRIVRDRGAVADLQAFVYLPFPFIDANAQIDPALEAFYQHNAWAFFEEMNYFLDNPTRMTEYVLDPHRRLHDPARPASDYGMDLFRTVYLIGNHIPPLGTLELGNELHSYVANGIFHTFLTPEEGAIQSHYSNIKAKLKDKDQIYGSIKRFATFGYAEYRRRGDAHAEHLVQDAVARDWDALLGDPPLQDQMHAEARTLNTALMGTVNQIVGEASSWVSSVLPSARFVTRDPADLSRMGAIIGSVLQNTDTDQEEKLQELSMKAAENILRDLEANVRERLVSVPRGLRAEAEVLARLRDLIAHRMPEFAGEEPKPLRADEELVKQAERLRADMPKPGKRFIFTGPYTPDENKISDFERRIETFVAAVRKKATERLTAQVEIRIHTILGRTIDTRLGDLIRELQRTIGWLEEHRPVRPRVTALLVSPTIQEVPPSELSHGQGFDAQAELFRAQNEVVVAPRRRELWSETLTQLLRGRSEAAAHFHARLEELWHSRVVQAHGDKTIREWIQFWADQIAERESGRQRSTKDIERELLSRLIPLSTPACAIDRTTLDKADTVPEIIAVVGPFETEGQAATELSARGPCALIEDRAGERIAVLQTWYAFSSRAVEGMETLRRSYLKRDRRNSLPHIHKEWNDRGLGERIDLASRFDSQQITHVVRVLAISKFFCRADANGNMAPGVIVRRDSRDQEQPYLLEYRHEGGRSVLRWREILAVEGYRDTWEMPYLNGNANDAPAVNGAGWNFEQDVSGYLSSECRERHAQFLGQVERLERSPELKPKYLDAYDGYLAILNKAIKEEEGTKRERHLPMLHRLTDALHKYVEQLREDDQPGL